MKLTVEEILSLQEKYKKEKTEKRKRKMKKMIL